MKNLFITILLLLFLVKPSLAQQVITICVGPNTSCIPVSTSSPLPTSSH